MHTGTLSVDQLLLLIALLLSVTVQIYFTLHCDTVYQLAIPIVLLLVSFIYVIQQGLFQRNMSEGAFLCCMAMLPSLLFLTIRQLVLRHKKNLLNK